MTPYRTSALTVRAKARPRQKTWFLKALIRWKGTWRQRWVRCPCGKGVAERPQNTGNWMRSILQSILIFSCGHHNSKPAPGVNWDRALREKLEG